MWGVTRGVGATTPVTHATNFTIQQVVSAGGLSNFAQMENNAVTVATGTVNSTSAKTVATYTPLSTDVPAAGTSYDVNAFGFLTTGSTAEH